MRISNNNEESVPLQQFNHSTLPVGEKEPEDEQKDYIKLARFLFRDDWQYTKKILTFVRDDEYFSELRMLTTKAAELLDVGTGLENARRSMMGESGYSSVEERISESDANATFDILILWARTPNFGNDQHDDTFYASLASYRQPDSVDAVPPWAMDMDYPVWSETNPTRVIELMKLLYVDAQWEYTKLALEWGFDRTKYTRAKVVRLYTEGGRLAEEFRRLLTSRSHTEEEVNSVLRSYLDGPCFDISEADVEATLDIVQTWDYYMSRDGDKISKFLDDVGNVAKD
ncbi:hypothetical protein EAE96_005111 [Botrytis aclada]|nr:hypothetical protein EAE96_005111 [Botrytis aclada]